LRVCFIGDSHLACIKQAWDDGIAEQNPQIEATYFALPGKGMDYLTVQDGCLGSSEDKIARTLKFTSGGLARIEPSYDAYVLHGMHLSIVSALELCREPEIRRRLRNPDFLASAEFRERLCSAIENSVGIGVLRKLRMITQALAVIAPTPFADARLPALRSKMVQFGAARPLAVAFNDIASLVCRDLGAVFVPQSAETLADDGLAAKAEYSLNPSRFHDAVAKEDPSHMNEQYGAITLTALLEAVSLACPGAPNDQSAATSAAL